MNYESSRNSDSNRNYDSYELYDRNWGWDEPRMWKKYISDHIVSNILHNNKVNNIVRNKLKFYYNYILPNIIEDNQKVATFYLRTIKKIEYEFKYWYVMFFV